MSKKALVTVALILFATVPTCWAQQKEKRRPGITTIWGPARIVRVEQADPVMQNGELVEGPRVLVQTITYSEDGTEHERTSFKPDGSVAYKTAEIYDRDGRLLESATFRDNGHLGKRIVNNYDGDKRLAWQVVYGPDGLVSSKSTFAYKDNLQTSEIESYDKTGRVASISHGRIDLKEPRNHVHTTTANERVFTNESTFKQTPEGQEYIAHENGEEIQHTLQRPLGKDGTEIVRFNPDGTVLRTERLQNELDAHGNFVKRTMSVSSGDAKFKPVSVLYRTIEYYGEK